MPKFVVTGYSTRGQSVKAVAGGTPCFEYNFLLHHTSVQCKPKQQ